MIIAILRTYYTEDTFTDEQIRLPDGYWEREILDANDDFIQYQENMIQPNQSIINPEELKDEYKSKRWSRACGRPGHVFRMDYLDNGRK